MINPLANLHTRSPRVLGERLLARVALLVGYGELNDKRLLN